MNKDLFSIGEISEIKGITIKALRFYEKIGLLRPHYIDPTTKYRFYSIEQFIQLDIIKAARSMEISPKDVKVILEKKDTNILLEFMNYQKESAEKKILELQRIITIIDTAQKTIHNSITSVTNTDIFFKELPERYIVTKKLGEDFNEKEILIEYSKFYKIIEENMLISTYETGIIFTPNANSEFHPTQIFNSVTLDDKSNSSVLSSIQPGRFLCICYSKQNAHEQLSILNRHIDQSSLKPILIVQVDLLNNVFEANTQYVELQVLL